MTSMNLRELLKDFECLAARALRLEQIREGVFRSVFLWTPSLSKATYGGQLIAHSAEAAYRTVDVTHMMIHSLHLTFVSIGQSDLDEPIVYTVRPLRTGRTVCARLVTATQQSRTVLVALVNFHRHERSGVAHQTCAPKRDVSSTLATYVEQKGQKMNPPSSSSTQEDEVALVEYLNLMEHAKIQTTTPWDVWMRIGQEDLSLLQSLSGIPIERLHIIIACWLSDFIVAFAALLPHELPNDALRLIASLDHAIYFHTPEQVRVDEWFLYEVVSPWAAQGRGFNNGRMYGRDGTLWMSTAQETLLRMKQNYTSKL